MQYLSAEPIGLLLYMRGHDGRGIEIFEKVRAYRHQEELAEDTVDANANLGLPIDGRSYAEAVDMLRRFGFPAIRLLTNNPLKIDAMEGSGIRVTERIPLIAPGGPIAAGYLTTKRGRLEHLIDNA